MGLSNTENLVPSRSRAVGYMERTRNYYRALGYSKDYTWSQNDEIPFARPTRPLKDMTVAVVTTTSPAGTTSADTPAVWSADASVMPKSMYSDNLAWDKESTHTDDTGSFLPMNAMRQMVKAQELGAVAARYQGVPTEYSQRQTLTNDAPEILDRLIADNADAALLVPL